MVFHPVRQVASDGLGDWGDGGVKINVGIHVPEMVKTREKARPSRARLLSSTNLSALTDRASSCVTTSVKN